MIVNRSKEEEEEEKEEQGVSDPSLLPIFETVMYRDHTSIKHPKEYAEAGGGEDATTFTGPSALHPYARKRKC